MLPSGRSRSSAGNSSNTTKTTGGRRTADLASSSSPGSAQPASATAAISSTVSQHRHTAAVRDLEDLDTVPPLAQRILRNHDGIALHRLATQVEASPNRGDAAIHPDRDVALAARAGAVDTARHLARDDPAGAPDVLVRARQRQRRSRTRGHLPGGDPLPDQLAVRAVGDEQA